MLELFCCLKTNNILNKDKTSPMQLADFNNNLIALVF